MPEPFREAAAKYVEMARGYGPQGAYYLSNHRGHLMFVREDERPYLTADLIRHATWTATAPELIERIAAIEAAGFNQIVFSILPGQEHAVEDWGRMRRAFA
jgi:5,10-methylenetetrahydromethanopterin reductase